MTDKAGREAGRKDDAEKLRYDLLPVISEEDIVKVLTYGATKYGADNWRQVPDAKRRYLAAFRRHVVAWRKGELTDPESGLPHLAHAACSLIFLHELDQPPPIDSMACPECKHHLHNHQQDGCIVKVSQRGPNPALVYCPCKRPGEVR